MEMWPWSEMETSMQQWVAGGSWPPELSSFPADVVSSRDGDRKFILRGWSLVFNVLATLMVLSVADGRLAYLQGSYTGYLGIWTDCRKHKCASLGQVTVLIHMSMGFMMLALTLCLILLPTMGLSFRPVFRRLTKIDLVFSSLSFSIGLLIVLSLTLFVVNCETLRPRPQVSYLVTTYLCWAAGALMLWAGALSYLNHVGMWSKRTSIKERRVRIVGGPGSRTPRDACPKDSPPPTGTCPMHSPPQASRSSSTRASQDADQ
ncbi:hypothetical protein GH733_017174 [Mirounga leonina]|nr:hypothetical protein GH733_017174 [Mirounga leonina]